MSRSDRVEVIGIGAQKCATDWLYRCMAEHPEIAPSDRKEVNFFNHNWERGYYWYHDHFDFGVGKTVEYSTQYLPDRNVPERIRAYNPDARLIVSLRDPVERAYSQHRHQIKRERLPAALYRFGDALPQNPSYVEQGFYARHLRRFLEAFSRDQLHVVLFDDIRSEPRTVLRELFTFLAVDPEFEPSILTERVNYAFRLRLPAVERLFRSVSRTVRELLGEEGLEAMKSLGVQDTVRRLNRREFDPEEVPPMAEEIERELRERFQDDVAELEALLGRRLEGWHWDQP